MSFALERFCAEVEVELCRNYHYAHARRLGQLRPLQVSAIAEGLEAYRAARVRGGARVGTVKFPALQCGEAIDTTWWCGRVVQECSDHN